MARLKPRQADEYHVFLSSPSDVDVERKAVRDFFDDFNRLLRASGRDARFVVVDWENYSSTGARRPQELINETTLEKYRDSLVLVIGILGLRFGSPTGTHESGTQEEFEWVIRKKAKTSWPEVKWFFRRVNQFTVGSGVPERIKEALDQWTKVLAFRKALTKPKPRVLWKEFDGPHDFADVLRKDLSSWLEDETRPWHQDSKNRGGKPNRPVTLAGSRAASKGFPLRDKDLEDSLRRQFDLREAVVVDIEEFTHSPQPKSTKVRDRADNHIHETLGVWGARILSSTIRPNDTVGVGAGRACYHAIQEIAFHVGFTVRGVVSLTGRTGTNQWPDPNGIRQIDMDGDVLAQVLGRRLQREPVCVGTPIVCAHAKSLDFSQVDLALVGVGALSGGHSLRHYEKGGAIDAFWNQLESIGELADKHDQPDAKPVPLYCLADICNFVFLAEAGSPLWNTISAMVRSSLKTAVDRLNAQFRCPKAKDFQEICTRGGVIAIAGGRHKAAALSHILNQRPQWISHLVTDTAAARAILFQTQAFSSS